MVDFRHQLEMGSLKILKKKLTCGYHLFYRIKIEQKKVSLFISVA